MKYLLLICTEGPMDFEAGPPEADTAPADPADDDGEDAIDVWLTEIARRGVREFGDRVRPAEDATTVRVRNGEVLVVDGPYAETKEQMCGIDVIECENLDLAVEIASLHPLAKYGMIEVRPFWPL
jgi:hypothetical protein